MIITRLYSNRDDLFDPITFNQHLSVIVAQIRLPENKGTTVHNLGKSTVAQLVDFCLLRSKRGEFFLFKHDDLFSGMVFYLELQLSDKRYLTIARSVDGRDPVSFLLSDSEVEDAREVEYTKWAHIGIGFKNAKRFLNGYLDFQMPGTYSYRNVLGYILRDQRDYNNVFHLGKYKGKDKQWKPFLAELLGFDSSLILEFYSTSERIDELEKEINSLYSQLGGYDEDEMRKLEGLVDLRERELYTLEDALDSFNFSESDSAMIDESVNRVEVDISALNEERYELEQRIIRLEDSLDKQSIMFSSDEAEELFREVGIAFEGKLKRNFDDLIKFNRAISKERKQYLEEDLTNSRDRLIYIKQEVGRLELRRSELVGAFSTSESVAKFRQLSEEVINLRSNIKVLRSREDGASGVKKLRQRQRDAQAKLEMLQNEIENSVDETKRDPEGRFSKIRRYFDEIVNQVLNAHALLSVTVNSRGNLDFSADFVDGEGIKTSADSGFSYRKLLCIAFDLALVRSYIGTPFPRFCFHDGAFEGLEPRARERLLEVFRQYAAEGIQPVITTLDADIPGEEQGDFSGVHPREVISILHDDGDEGRLFKMSSF